MIKFTRHKKYKKSDVMSEDEILELAEFNAIKSFSSEKDNH